MNKSISTFVVTSGEVKGKHESMKDHRRSNTNTSAARRKGWGSATYLDQHRQLGRQRKEWHGAGPFVSSRGIWAGRGSLKRRWASTALEPRGSLDKEN